MQKGINLHFPTSLEIQDAHELGSAWARIGYKPDCQPPCPICLCDTQCVVDSLHDRKNKVLIGGESTWTKPEMQTWINELLGVDAWGCGNEENLSVSPAVYYARYQQFWSVLHSRPVPVPLLAAPDFDLNDHKKGPADLDAFLKIAQANGKMPDILTFHLYKDPPETRRKIDGPTGWYEKMIALFSGDGKPVAEIAKKYGIKRVWLTEYSKASDKGEDKQAAYFQSFFAEKILTPEVAFVYTITDAPASQEKPFGLCHADGTRKAAFFTVKNS